MLVLFSLLAGCASGSNTAPHSVGDGQMMGMQDAGDGFTFRKAMPDRRDFKPWEFYYKHCSEAGPQVYYSKTSYDCTGPYY